MDCELSKLTDISGRVAPEVADSKWIWTNIDPEESDVWVWARKSINVESGRNACIHITADTRYVLWVNERMVGFGPPKSHVSTPTLDTYPLDGILHPGENVVAVLVYSFGSHGHITGLMPRRGAMIGSIDVDGERIPTDSSWLMARDTGYIRTGVRYNEHQPFVEQFDDRFSLGDAWRLDYDDSDWGYARELSGPIWEPWVAIENRDIPLFNWEKVRAGDIYEWGVGDFGAAPNRVVECSLAEEIASAERLPATSGEVRVVPGAAGDSPYVICDASDLAPSESTYVIYNFGRLLAGYPVLTFSGSPGSVVDISYAEGLLDGRVRPDKQGIVYVDRIVLGDRRLTHRILHPKCLQYLQLDVRGGCVKIEDVHMQASTYPVLRVGSFSSDDPVLDRCWEISANTVRLCMEDSYMDSPHRERGGWIGDAVVEAHANYYAFGDYALARRMLIQHARGQMEDGYINGKYPGKVSSKIHSWNLSYAFMLSGYLAYSGDAEIARELVPTVQHIGEWLESYRLKDGTYGNFPLDIDEYTNVYTFIDWSPVITKGACAAFNAFAYRFWKAAGELAKVAGMTEYAEECSDRAESVKEGFHVFWDNARGVFVNAVIDGEQTARYGVHENSLALLFGLADESQRERIARMFDAGSFFGVFRPDTDAYDGILGVQLQCGEYRWPDDKRVPVGTPYFCYWMLSCMCEAGMLDMALRFIRVHWGEIARQGGSSCWECWTQEDGTLSHGWSSAPVVILGRYVLGASPSDEPGVWDVFPSSGGLNRASGRVPTPYGELGIGWQISDGWKVSIQIPHGLSVRLGVPDASVASVLLNGSPVRTSATERNGKLYGVLELGAGRHVIETSR